MVELADSEREILMVGRDLMARLIAGENWLPEAYAVTPPGVASVFQIYRDVLERFTIVSTIIDAGASHSVVRPGLWEISGVYRGEVYRQAIGGGEAKLAGPGAVETFKPGGQDGFRLSNAGEDVAILIQVYGGDIAGLALCYANGESAAPYDIFTIQADRTD